MVIFDAAWLRWCAPFVMFGAFLALRRYWPFKPLH
jgi:hypothetical protein